jgi:hypothetical protein
MRFTGDLIHLYPLTAVEPPIVCMICGAGAVHWAGINTGHSGGTMGSFHVDLPGALCDPCWILEKEKTRVSI